MPALESPCNKERAEAIAQTLRDEDYQILLFQKAFTEDARDAIVDILGNRYPHRFGPFAEGDILHLNGGLWILSSLPLKVVKAIAFDDAEFPENLARKGAVLLEGRWGGQDFQIVNTHLQGDEDPAKGHNYQDVRNRQLTQLAKELLEPFQRKDVPQIICGDMSTSHFAKNNGTGGEADGYRAMLHILDVPHPHAFSLTWNDSKDANDLARWDSKSRKEMDYIFIRNREKAIASFAQKVRVFRKSGWDKLHPKHADLAYRYAVEGVITFAE